MVNNRDNHGPMGPIGPQLIIPSSFADALSYAQQLEWLYLHKQDKLVPGENVAINENADGTATISVIGSLDARGIKSITGNLGLDGTTVTVTLTDDTTQQFFVQRGAQGLPGEDGSDGSDGVSPEVTIENITDGHRVTITDAEHPSGQSFDIMNGSDGQPGQDGSDGVSPVVTVTSITGGNRVTITDAEHPSGQSFDIMNGSDGQDGQNGTDGSVFWTCAGGHNYELSNTYYFYIANIVGPAGRTPQVGDVIISVESPTAVWALTITETGETSVGAEYFANIKGNTGAQGNPGPAGEGVPTGGTQGQVLAKASGTNYDTEWVDPSGLPAVVDHSQDLVVGVNAGGTAGWKSLDALYPKIDKVQNVIAKVYRKTLASLGADYGVLVSLTDIGSNQYRLSLQNEGESSVSLPVSMMLKVNGIGDCFVTVESGTGMASLQGYNQNGTMRYDYLYFEGFITVAAGTTESTVIELHPGTGSLSITDDVNYYSYTKYDAQNGIVKGGTTGQVLKKSSNSNFAVEWDDISLPKLEIELTNDNVLGDFSFTITNKDGTTQSGWGLGYLNSVKWLFSVANKSPMIMHRAGTASLRLTRSGAIDISNTAKIELTIRNVSQKIGADSDILSLDSNFNCSYQGYMYGDNQNYFGIGAVYCSYYSSSDELYITLRLCQPSGTNNSDDIYLVV